MYNKTVKNPEAPASPRQCITLMRMTGHYWAKNTGKKSDDGKDIWEALITKGVASGHLDLLFNAAKDKKAAAVANVMKQHPLGDKATPVARPEPKGTRRIELPEGVDREKAMAMIAAMANGQQLLALPVGKKLDNPQSVLGPAMNGTFIGFDSQNDFDDACAILGAAPESIKAADIAAILNRIEDAGQIIVLGNPADRGNAIKALAEADVATEEEAA